MRGPGGTRFVRLTPLRQAGLLAGFALALGWGVTSTAIVAIDALGGGSGADLLEQQRRLYEARLIEVAAERDARTRQARDAQARFEQVLGRLSTQQSLLLASEDRRRELETALEVMQDKLRRAFAERDAARAELAALEERLAKAGGAMPERVELDVARRTQEALVAGLERTAADRDRAEEIARKARAEAEEARRREKVLRERNERIFARLEEALTVSVAPLERMFEQAGISTDKLLRDVRAGYSGAGGPLGPVAVSTKAPEELDPDWQRANRLLGELDRINLYRIAAYSTPFGMPVRSAFRFTSGFGMRRHPITHRRQMHEGLDFAAPYGTPIYATADGVVVRAGWAGGYGKMVEIRHAGGITTRYAHMSRIRVKKGQRVSRGERIGDMGSTGRSTGSHLHYEIRLHGKPVNPMKFIRAARNVF
ncbi:MAG: M23 family peptidase [Alphaproteobacteria bacterium]|nr:MAG: M23 family peptidase [Alphaproteobacteria bacterium]